MDKVRSLVTSFVACLAIGPMAGAQLSVKAFEEVQGPLGRVHYNLSKGEVTKVVRPRQVQSLQEARAERTGQRAVVRSFRNTITTGYYFSGTLGATDLDWSDKATGYRAVHSFAFGYATYARDPRHWLPPGSWPGASMIVSFFTGTTGFCNLGVQQASFNFQGLPGVTNCIGTGSNGAYVLTAFSADPSFCLPDGMIGWGYTHTDDRGIVTGSPPTGYSGTGALLVNFGTHATTGWDDLFDIWMGFPASTASCSGTWWFGGCNTADPWPSPPCASFYMGLNEIDSANALVATNNGTGVNPMNLSAVGLPRIGLPLTIDYVVPPPFSAGGYAISVLPAPFPIPLSGPTAFGELLLDLSGLLELRVGVGTAQLLIPCDTGLDGMTVHIQSFRVTGLGPITLQLHNRLDLTIGG